MKPAPLLLANLGGSLLRRMKSGFVCEEFVFVCLCMPDISSKYQMKQDDNVCMWFLNQSQPVETAALFASSKITHILTLDLHMSVPGSPALLHKSTEPGHFSRDMMTGGCC